MNDASPSTPSGPAALVKVERAFLALSMIGIVAMGAMVTASIIGRTLFGVALPDTDIIIGELMVASMILPLAYVAGTGAHIAVDVFARMAPQRAQPWLRLLAALAGFAVIVPIAWGGYTELTGALVANAYYYGDLFLPEWPGRTAYLLGFLLFAFRCLVEAAREVMIILGRDAPGTGG
ncbi:MAG: TRAP transporter small permease [Paracoccaceae bacterium]